MPESITPDQLSVLLFQMFVLDDEVKEGHTLSARYRIV